MDNEFDAAITTNYGNTFSSAPTFDGLVVTLNFTNPITVAGNTNLNFEFRFNL